MTGAKRLWRKADPGRMDGTVRGNEYAGRRDARDYPLVNRFDEVDTLMVLDNVLIP